MLVVAALGMPFVLAHTGGDDLLDISRQGQDHLGELLIRPKERTASDNGCFHRRCGSWPLKLSK